MAPDKYLQSIRDLNKKIEIYKMMRRETEEALNHIKASIPSDDRVQRSRTGGLDTKIIRNMEKLEEIDSWISAANTKQLSRKNDALQKIEALKEGQCKQFLLDYYIAGKSEKQIAREYHFSNFDSVYGLKTRALKYFKKEYSNC